MVPPWRTPGDIIRWWRTDILGLSQQEVAEKLSVRATALSNWENDNRAISVDIEYIDKSLGAEGVLAGLLWALKTPEGLDSSRVFSNFFPGPSTPVWMWLRSEAPTVRIEAEWGVFRIDADIELGPNGLFVTVGASVRDSPVVVQVSAPAWADFGRGHLPPEVPGAQVIEAVDIARRSTATGVFMDLFSANLATRFEGSNHDEIASLERKKPRLVRAFFSQFARPSTRPIAGPWPPLPEGVGATERQKFAALRHARGLSQAETAERLALRTGTNIGKDTLRRFENDLGAPQDELLPAALDHVLGANGHLALAELRSGRGSGTVRLPAYWHAPVWLAFDGPPGSDPPELHWGPWWRKVGGDLPLLIVSHYAEPLSPLRITVGPRVRWTFGLGRRPGAVINHEWIPASVDDAQRAVADTEAAVVEAIRRADELKEGPDSTT